MTKPINHFFGFTLIEMLVVVSIIGVLTTLVFANLNAARERARDAQRKSDLRSIQTALRIYYNDKNIYPPSDSAGNIKACGSGGGEVCNWGETWESGGTTYMSVIPTDPLGSQTYYYEQQDGGDAYLLQTCLENKSDSKGVASSASWCTSGWVYQLIP